MKKIRKRIAVVILSLFLTQTVWAQEPTVAAQGAALLDGKTGRLLWGKEAKTPMEMASTTKIMTAILVLENANPYDVVTVSKNAAKQPDVQMDLLEGEQWYVKDLLTAMMLKSYNDAAVALAEHVSGSVEKFCEEMTKKAAEIGAKDTVFGSPNGLDSHLTKQQHHATAYDMGLITGYALQNPEFREIVATPSITFSDVSGKRVHTAVNTDRFLQMYGGALGVKTGYTNKAGNCFVGAAEQNDVMLVSVVLGCGWGEKGKKAKWTDTTTLMDYGFENFGQKEVVAKDTQTEDVAVSRSPKKYVHCVLAEGYDAVFSDAELKEIQMISHLPEMVEAPIQKGEKLGMVDIVLHDEILKSIEIVAAECADTYTFGQWMEKLLQSWCRFTIYLYTKS